MHQHHVIRHRLKELVGVVYRKFDGYPEEEGMDVIKFLRDARDIGVCMHELFIYLLKVLARVMQLVSPWN